MPEPHVLSVIADLEHKQAAISMTISLLRETFGVQAELGPQQAALNEAKVIRIHDAKPVVKTANKLPNKMTGISKVASRPYKREGGVSISETIRQVISQNPDSTAIDITTRVVSILPEVKRETVSTIICQLIKTGQLRKDEQLRIRMAAS